MREKVGRTAADAEDLGREKGKVMFIKVETTAGDKQR